MSDKQPVPTFKVFFLQEKSDESYSSKLLLNLREILKDDRSPYEHEGLQTISGSYGDNEIKIDVVSRCSTAFARLSNDTYDLIILPVHGSCFTSELERYCKESDKTAFADKIIIREVGDLVKWETREKNYPINSVKAKDVIYINVVEDEDDLLLNTIIGFFGKIEININFDKDFNSDKIDKINSTLLGISPFISTRPQPKSDLGKDVAIQIMSHSSSEKTSMVDVDGCTIYLNCSKSVVRFTKSVIAKFSKKFTGEPSETTANYDQLSKEIIGLIDHKSLELFHSALSRPEAEKIIELKPENPELEKYHSYYKDQLGEIKNLVVEGIDSEKRVQIQNILESIDKLKLHQRSNQLIKLAFISYAHSGENRKHIWDISSSLNREGIDVRIDQYYSNPGDWKGWMEAQISNANHVIQFFSYFNQVAESFPIDGKGRGVIFESDIIENEKYRDPLNKKKFIYVLHDNDDISSKDHLPPTLINSGHNIFRYPSQLDDIVSFVKGIQLS